MSTRKNTLARKVLASVGAATLGLMGIAGLSATALADPVGPDGGPGQSGAPTSGSLNIHKYIGTEGSAGNGMQQIINPDTHDPLDDVEFTIWRLGLRGPGDTCVQLDLAQPSAWSSVPNGAAPATLEEVKAAGFCVVTPGYPKEAITDGGEASFLGLPLGLYYVQETDAPANIVSRTAPFYVTVPYPNEGQWVYNVHVYPKNQELDAPTKVINPDMGQPAQGLTEGSTVTWTITQKLPALNAGEDYTKVEIWDNLPAGLGAPTDSAITVNGAAHASSGPTTVAGKTTWALTLPPPPTASGLEPGDTVVLTFKTVVLVEGATTNSTYGSTVNGTTTPGTGEPTTYWGRLQIKKVDNKNAILPGAQFKVFNNYTGSECPTIAPETGALATGTSGTDGIVMWDATDPASSPLRLFVHNSNDAVAPSAGDQSKTYCVYETFTPAGYVGLTAPIAAVITGDGVLTIDTNDLTVKNTQKKGPTLPLTGASGTMLMTIGGIGLVAVAGGLYLATRRKAHQE